MSQVHMFLHGLSQKTDCAGKESPFWVFPSAVPCNYVFFMFFTHETLSSHVFAFVCNYTWALAMWSRSADKKPCTHRPKSTNRRSESIRGIASSIVALFACGGLFRPRQARSQRSKKCKMLSSSARKNAWCSFKNAMEGQVQNLHISCFCCVCVVSLLCTGKVLFVSQTVRTCQPWGCA